MPQKCAAFRHAGGACYVCVSDEEISVMTVLCVACVESLLCDVCLRHSAARRAGKASHGLVSDDETPVMTGFLCGTACSESLLCDVCPRDVLQPDVLEAHFMSTSVMMKHLL